MDPSIDRLRVLTMQIQIKYFASIREALGMGVETIDIPLGATAGTLRQVLQARSAAHAAVLAPGRAVRCAVNQVMALESTVLPANAEVAFFPPVTGG
jgi:molybdopterin synthase sulfur carrier subunit